MTGAGDGFGIMLGDGLACYDLDHVVDEGGTVEPWAIEFVATIAEPLVLVELSRSRRGLHIFVRAPEAPGWRRGGAEFYSRQRFIVVTGLRPPQGVMTP